MSEELLRIEAGVYTEELATYIFSNLPDKEVDELEMERYRAPVTGLAREPITIAVGIFIFIDHLAEATAVAATAIFTIGHLIERFMDQRYNSLKTDQAITLYAKSPELAKLLLQSVGKFSKVAVENEIKPVDAE